MDYLWMLIAVGVSGYFGFLFWQVTHLRRVTWHLMSDYDSLGEWLHAARTEDEHGLYAKLLDTGGQYAKTYGYEPKLSFDPDFRRIMLPDLAKRINSGLNVVRLRYAIPVSVAVVTSYFMEPLLPVVCLCAFLVSSGIGPVAAGRNALFIHLAVMTYMLERWDSLDTDSCRRFVHELPLFDPLYRHMKRLSAEMGGMVDG